MSVKVLGKLQALSKWTAVDVRQREHLLCPIHEVQIQTFHSSYSAKSKHILFDFSIEWKVNSTFSVALLPLFSLQNKARPFKCFLLSLERNGGLQIQPPPILLPRALEDGEKWGIETRVSKNNYTWFLIKTWLFFKPQARAKYLQGNCLSLPWG